MAAAASAFLPGTGYPKRSGTTAAFNAALFIVIVGVAINAGRDIRLFTYPWTYHKHAGHGAVGRIIDHYDQQRRDGNESLEVLRQKVYAEANCTAIDYAGSHWAPETVSPLCNCVANLHTVYAVSIQMTETVSDTDATFAERSRLIKEHLRDVCGKLSRPTHVEGMTSPESTSATNIVVSTVLWNMVSLVSSLFSVFFSVASNESHKRTSFLVMIGASVACVGLWIWMLVVGGITDWGNWLQTGAFVVFLGVTALMAWLVDRSDNNFTVRNSIVHWFGYAINLSLAFTSVNCLSQRRDYGYNIMFIVIAMCMSMTALASDYVSYFKAFLAKNYADMTGYKEEDIRQLQIFDTKKIHNYIWGANMVFVVTIFNLSGSAFTPNQFSNAQGVIWIVLPILLNPLILLPNGLRSPDEHVPGSVIAKYPNESPGAIPLRERLDFLARFIFTAAVIADVASVANKDYFTIPVQEL